MGLAPSENSENIGKSVVAKVPVPIFSQPRSVNTSIRGFGLISIDSGRVGFYDQRQNDFS
jgi:hypothetical protein